MNPDQTKQTTTPIEKVTYTAKAHTTGGRSKSMLSI